MAATDTLLAPKATNAYVDAERKLKAVASDVFTKVALNPMRDARVGDTEIHAMD